MKFDPSSSASKDRVGFRYYKIKLSSVHNIPEPKVCGTCRTPRPFFSQRLPKRLSIVTLSPKFEVFLAIFAQIMVDNTESASVEPCKRLEDN